MSEEARIQSQANVNLGRGLYADEHNVQGAIEALERAVRLDPENAEARLLLGQVYGSQALWPQAETHLRKAVELYTREALEDERARSPLAEARNSHGAVLINLNRASEAVGVLRPATEEVLYTAQHLVWGNLGLAYLRSGDAQHAVESLDRAVGLQPDFCVGRYRLGEAYYRLNDYGHALEALDRALGTQQRGCDAIQGAFLVRAQVRVQLHQPEPAREDLRRCVELGEATPEGRQCADLGRSVGVQSP